MNFEKLMKDIKSWKTTACGIIVGLMTVLPEIIAVLDNDPETTFTKATFMTGLAMMGIGVAAKDGDKSSEDVS